MSPVGGMLKTYMKRTPSKLVFVGNTQSVMINIFHLHLDRYLNINLNLNPNLYLT